VTQNLTSVLNTVNFDLPTIFIPTGSEEHRYIPNSIESVCKEMEDTISQSVQNAIVSLGADCQKVFDRIGSFVLYTLACPCLAHSYQYCCETESWIQTSSSGRRIQLFASVHSC
jgi:hypothetical protein